MPELKLTVHGFVDSDDRERAELTADLESVIRRCDVQAVSRPMSSVPRGAKGSGVEWAQLVVSFIGTVPPLLTVLSGWLDRHKGSSITVELDGDSITLAEASDDERAELISVWVRKHGG
jgi:hypothetical protein